MNMVHKCGMFLEKDHIMYSQQSAIIIVIIIISPMFPHTCMHAGLALLYLALHRGLLPNLKGFCNQTSGENENTETTFFLYDRNTRKRKSSN